MFSARLSFLLLCSVAALGRAAHDVANNSCSYQTKGVLYDDLIQKRYMFELTSLQDQVTTEIWPQVSGSTISGVKVVSCGDESEPSQVKVRVVSPNVLVTRKRADASRIQVELTAYEAPVLPGTYILRDDV